jgi:hypothetical protein
MDIRQTEFSQFHDYTLDTASLPQLCATSDPSSSPAAQIKQHSCFLTLQVFPSSAVPLCNVLSLVVALHILDSCSKITNPLQGYAITTMRTWKLSVYYLSVTEITSHLSPTRPFSTLQGSP